MEAAAMSPTMRRLAAVLLPKVLLIGAAVVLGGCERPPPDTVQRGFRGTGMVQVHNPRIAAQVAARNQAPAPLPPAEAGGQKASEVYKNVQVLGDLSVAEFTRTMIAISNWVSPKEQCAYCHAGADFASDDLYTKIVARRMLEMTRHINTDWKNHVAETGVTCYTCHRGQHVPANVWFTLPEPRAVKGMAGNHAGQNTPAYSVGVSSLPFDPFTPFLLEKNGIRVASEQALPSDNRHSIQQTEWTYGLMMHFSDSLGVNCTYCHNSRSFSPWDQSTPQRNTAWYGIRMVRDLNTAYLEPLKPQYPAARLGPLGDAPKANCSTCHQGVHKPLYGVSMLKDHPELATSGQPMRAPSTTQ
jgi:photosynthetic reaction center cytochrome c subunit